MLLFLFHIVYVDVAVYEVNEETGTTLPELSTHFHQFFLLLLKLLWMLVGPSHSFTQSVVTDYVRGVRVFI